MEEHFPVEGLGMVPKYLFPTHTQNIFGFSDLKPPRCVKSVRIFSGPGGEELLVLCCVSVLGHSQISLGCLKKCHLEGWLCGVKASEFCLQFNLQELVKHLVFLSKKAFPSVYISEFLIFCLCVPCFQRLSHFLCSMCQSRYSHKLGQVSRASVHYEGNKKSKEPTCGISVWLLET